MMNSNGEGTKDSTQIADFDTEDSSLTICIL